MKKTNVAEDLFEQYLRAHCYQFERIPESRAPGEKTPDYRVNICGSHVYVEAERVVATKQERELLRRHRSLGQRRPERVKNAVRRAARQLKPYAGHPCLIVMHSESLTVDVQSDSVLEAMFGQAKWPLQDVEGEIKIGTPFFTGHGRIIHPEHPAPHVSAVAAVEKFRPIMESPEGLVQQLVGDHPRSNAAEWCARFWEVRNHIRCKYPQIDLQVEVVRLRVYENPAAVVPLPRDVFRASTDTRWGIAENGKHYAQLSGPREC